LEVFKYILGVDLKKHRAATINLGTNTYVLEELPDPIRVKSGMDPQTVMPVVAVPEGFTVWDSIEIHGNPNMTIDEFAEELARVHHGVELDMLTSKSGKILFNSTDTLSGPPEKKAAALAVKSTPLIQVYEEVVGPVFPVTLKYVLLEASVANDSGDTCLIPWIRFTFRK